MRANAGKKSLLSHNDGILIGISVSYSSILFPYILSILVSVSNGLPRAIDRRVDGKAMASRYNRERLAMTCVFCSSAGPHVVLRWVTVCVQSKITSS